MHSSLLELNELLVNPSSPSHSCPLSCHDRVSDVSIVRASEAITQGRVGMGACPTSDKVFAGTSITAPRGEVKITLPPSLELASITSTDRPVHMSTIENLRLAQQLPGWLTGS
jgi:hypothetical protein